MIYMGSKRRLVKPLSPIIQSYINEETTAYIEPFVGGGNMICHIDCPKRIGSDIDKYVIAVLKGLQAGMEPPREVSKEFYEEVKDNKDNFSDFLVGYIGYELCFGAKWFRGYAPRDDKKHRGDIYSYAHCMKQAKLLGDIDFECRDYREYRDEQGCVFYCDPPYRVLHQYYRGGVYRLRRVL